MVDSMAYHAKVENLKRMAQEVMLEADLDIGMLDEEDLMKILGYFDEVCRDLNSMDDMEERVHYLLKVIVVNSALVLMKVKEIAELRGK